MAQNELSDIIIASKTASEKNESIKPISIIDKFTLGKYIDSSLTTKANYDEKIAESIAKYNSDIENIHANITNIETEQKLKRQEKIKLSRKNIKDTIMGRKEKYETEFYNVAINTITKDIKALSISINEQKNQEKELSQKHNTYLKNTE